MPAYGQHIDHENQCEESKYESVSDTVLPLEGVVQSVSLDAAQEEHLGLIFPARVRLQQSALVIDGVKVQLTPGMNLSVEIKTGKRRVIDYLLNPLRQHSDEAMRER